MSEYSSFLSDHTVAIVVVILLMPINWLIDAVKWKWLLKKYVHIPVWSAIKGVLMGVSVGLFTPNGVGEFAGRMMAVPEENRQHAVSASIVGSLAQLAITITVGGACIVYFISSYVVQDYRLVSQIAALVTIVVGFYAYFHLPEIAGRVFHKIPKLERFRDFVDGMTHYSVTELFKAYGFAAARYMVFCTQLAILLFAVGGLSFAADWKMLFLIPVYYYVQSLIPTVALSEIGVRGLILAYLFQGTLLEPDVILVSFVIWIVNLILPGVVGLFAAWTIRLRSK